MSRKTAALAAAASQPLFYARPREPVRGWSGRSNEEWARARDRAVGALIGIALTGAMWAAWAMVTTNT